MELRLHSMMSYRGSPNWPPVWVKALSAHENKKVRGEVGILKEVAFPIANSRMTRCHLTIEFDNEMYVGTLLFDDPAFCFLIGKVLQNHVGRSVREIGDIDLSHVF